MIIYDKIKKYSGKIKCKKMLQKGRLKPEAFTRKGKIGFINMICFILNKRGVTLSMEIDNLKDIIGDDWEKVTESAICQQRKNIDPEVFKELNRDYIINTYDNPRDYETFKDYLVFAIDGMDIELPNTEKLREEFGHSKGKETQRVSARATTSSIYDVVNNMIIDSQIARYNTSERELAKQNIEEMLGLLGEQRKIIIFDRGYPSIELLNYLEKKGLKYLLRLGNKKFSKEIQRMKTEDEEVEIEITANRLRSVKEEKEREELRKKGKLKIRIVKHKLETGEGEILITNLSEKEFTKEEIGDLYYRRWKIELAYDIAKNKLEIENFSGQSKIVIEQEFYAQMSLLNIAEDLRKEANKKVKAKKENGYKYDYEVNMNVLIGQLRKKFLLIAFSMMMNKDDESEKRFFDFIEEIRSHIIPVRPGRKNARNEYKGYNKYKQNLRRNS